VRKKTVAVNEIIEKLELKNAHVDRTRIEEYSEKNFDIITARAVAYSDKLLKRSYSLLKKG
jgi:16S rRNA G527 N7-methylase RsmG